MSNANQSTKRDVPVVESCIVEGIAVVESGTVGVCSVVSCVADGTDECQIVVVAGLADVSSVVSSNAVSHRILSVWHSLYNSWLPFECFN